MPLYSKAPAECAEVCQQMLKKYHGDLVDAGVTVDFLFAQTDPEKDETFALKLHGYAANAIVKVVPYKLRVQDHADVEIVIDGDQWPAWAEDRRNALIDHELEHLELKRDKEGTVVRDDLDRPKMRLKLHDHEFGWFDSIARRHGAASFEVEQYESFKKAHRQMWLFDQAAEAPKNEADDDCTVKISSGERSVKTTGKKVKKAADSFTKEIAGEFRKRGILARGAASKSKR